MAGRFGTVFPAFSVFGIIFRSARFANQRINFAFLFDVAGTVPVAVVGVLDPLVAAVYAYHKPPPAASTLVFSVGYGVYVLPLVPALRCFSRLL